MNQSFKLSLFLAIALVFMGACKTLAPPASTGTTHSEDLSAYRIDYTAKEVDTATVNIDKVVEANFDPKLDITEKMEVLLDSIASRNKRIKSLPGYTIQVYSGSNREAANTAKRKVYMYVQDVQPDMQYLQPNYKVKVGSFLDRLEAQKMYVSVRKIFPKAIIIPTSIANK